ncbi:MAG TPA: YfbU family protein [Phototrophicaceae bacterium]|nr:YfbU family protein [Phototrophicaceae bacterium]
MKLTRAERWILSNQFEILARLSGDMDYYHKMKEVIDCGYELNYDWISDYVYDGDIVMSEADCHEVIDTLAMFDSLQQSFEKLTDKTGIDPTSIKFEGYDGNNESKYGNYAQFLMERDGKFGEVLHREGFDSHFPMRSRYNQMRQRWDESQNKPFLSKDDILRIIAR